MESVLELCARFRYSCVSCLVSQLTITLLPQHFCAVWWQATAKAFSSACSTDGFGKAEQESYAEATAQVYAKAVAGGIAIVIGGGW